MARRTKAQQDERCARCGTTIESGEKMVLEHASKYHGGCYNLGRGVEFATGSWDDEVI